MVQRLIALFALSAALAGCGGGEKTVAETPSSKAAATESASEWTPEQKAAMEKAISSRRMDDPNARGTGPK